MKNFFNNLSDSIIRLWKTRDELSLKNVRKSHLHYSLALIFCLTLVDLQISFFITDVRLWWMDSTTLMNISYSLAAALILLLRAKDFRWYFRISAVITIVGFFLWLVLPFKETKLIFGMLCWVGLGGCSACAVYAYAFILNNAERLFAIILITFNTALLVFLYEKGMTNTFLENILPMLLIIAVISCLLRFKPSDFPDTSKKVDRRTKGGSGMVLACVVAYFTLNIFGEALLRSGSERSVFALGMMVSVLFSLLIQLVFQWSIWHTWNVFLVLSTLGALLISLGQPYDFIKVGAFIFGIGMGVGYIVIFYFAGGLVKKYSSLSFFKQAMFYTVVVTLIPIVASGIVMNLWPRAFSVITFVLAMATLLLFTLFSPLFYQSLFGNGLAEEFHEMDVTGINQCFKVFGLTPREKEVCDLLLEGYTLRQISAIIGIGYPTVNTYCTNLYRKMAINSRTELFVKFGAKAKIQ